MLKRLKKRNKKTESKVKQQSPQMDHLLVNTSKNKVANKYYRKAQDYVNQGQYQKALKPYRQALKAEAQHVAGQALLHCLLLLGREAVEEKDKELAESYLKEAHALDPFHQEVNALLASVRAALYQTPSLGSIQNHASNEEQPQKDEALGLQVEHLFLQDESLLVWPYVGALENLFNEHCDRRQLKRISGAGSGAILACFLGLGFKIEEIITLLEELTIDLFLEEEDRRRLLKLKQKPEVTEEHLQAFVTDTIKQQFLAFSPQASGVFSADHWREAWAEKWIQAKTGISYATFAEVKALRESKGEEDQEATCDFYLLGLDQSTQHIQVFSAETTPDVIISDALHIAIAKPLIFKPHAIYTKNEEQQRIAQEGRYSMSGLQAYLPREEEQTLALCLLAANPQGEETKKAEKLSDYAFQLAHLMQMQREQIYFSQQMTDVIYLSSSLTTQQPCLFEVEGEEVRDLIAQGQLAVSQYLAAKMMQPPALLADSSAYQLLATAIAMQDSQTLMHLLHQGLGEEAKAADAEPLLDIALKQQAFDIILLLVQAGFYACHQPDAIRAILEEAKYNEFVDQALLENNIAAFAAYHATPASDSIPSPTLPHVGQSTPSPYQAFIEEGLVTTSIKIPYESLEKVKLLGKGGYAAVYQGKYEGGEVAIKEFFRNLVNKDKLEEFKAEAIIMAKLRHPHIVTVYGACIEEPNYVLVMEYLAGGSLHDVLESTQVLSWALRYQMAIDIGYGMAYLHRREVIHSDLKSLNVLLDHQFRAKVADFGVSIMQEGQILYGEKKKLVGSYPWMAPEILDESQENTKASDVFAYGATLCELSTRQIPFAGVNVVDMAKGVVAGKRTKPAADTPYPMVRTINACFAQDPAQRISMQGAVRKLEKGYQARFFHSPKKPATPLFFLPAADEWFAHGYQEDEGLHIKRTGEKRISISLLGTLYEDALKEEILQELSEHIARAVKRCNVDQSHIEGGVFHLELVEASLMDELVHLLVAKGLPLISDTPSLNPQ